MISNSNNNNNNNNSNINDYDYFCNGCSRHVPARFIETIIDFSQQTRDRGYAVHMNSVADIMVSLQRCPDCTLKILKWWKNVKNKKQHLQQLEKKKKKLEKEVEKLKKKNNVSS